MEPNLSDEALAIMLEIDADIQIDTRAALVNYLRDMEHIRGRLSRLISRLSAEINRREKDDVTDEADAGSATS